MNYSTPEVPIVGQKLKKGWGQDVARDMRSLVPIPTPGVRIHRGVNGSALMVEPATVEVERAKELLPFTLRWYDYGEDGTGQWQIYLPLGCMTHRQGDTVTGFRPVNDKAQDADGAVIPDWYRIESPEGVVSADVETLDDVASASSWPVYILMKPWPRVMVSCDPEAFGRCEWVRTAGMLRKVEFEDRDKPVRLARRMITETELSEEWDVSSAFAVRYTLDDPLEKDPVPRIAIVNEDMFIGRLQMTRGLITDATEDCSVWIEVRHDSETFSMYVRLDLDGEDAVSDDDRTVYKIYDIKEGVVERDLRGEVPDFDFYISPANPVISESYA